VSTALSSSLNLDEVLARTIDQILYILEAASVRVYMLDEEQQCLRLAAHKGVSGNFINRTEFRIRQVGDGLLGQTILTRQTKVVDNYLRADDPYVESIVAEGLKSSVYIPLFSKERPVGVLCVSSHYEYRFSPDFVEFLTAIGNQIGVAIENANLYHSLRRAYEELTQAQEQVIRTEKLASLGKLAATIAHEINNPLSVVLTYIKLIRKLADSDQLTPQRAPDITRYLTTMASETARCGEIVKNLLAFARHSKVTMEGHEAGEIIQRTVTLVAHDLQMKEMKLALDLDPHLPRIRCDFRQIQQALLNLLINAIEAMGKGGVLTISARRAPRDGFVAVAVSDTGCGIPEKNLESIFEPFFTTKAEAAGVGLGLSVVYGIVTKHGGTVEVRSREGRGSTFEIHLPAET
jgi:two-component system NtrC family sensor kinase